MRDFSTHSHGIISFRLCAGPNQHKRRHLAACAAGLAGWNALLIAQEHQVNYVPEIESRSFMPKHDGHLVVRGHLPPEIIRFVRLARRALQDHHSHEMDRPSKRGLSGGREGVCPR